MSNSSGSYLTGVDLACWIPGGYLCGECAALGPWMTAGGAQTGIRLPIEAKCVGCGGEVAHVERRTIPLGKGK